MPCDDGLDRRVAPAASPRSSRRSAGEAPYFALVTLRSADGAVEKQRIVPNPHRAPEKAKGIRVAEWLVAQKIDLVILHREMRGKRPEYVFREAGVELRHTAGATLSEALALPGAGQAV